MTAPVHWITDDGAQPGFELACGHQGQDDGSSDISEVTCRACIVKWAQRPAAGPLL